jgi:hypothetical protein
MVLVSLMTQMKMIESESAGVRVSLIRRHHRD